MLKTLFHTENRYDGHTVKTLITVFGIKIKIKNYIETLKKRCEKLESSFNENLINIFLELADENDLYFVKSGAARWIFSGKIKNVNRRFIIDYFLKSAAYSFDLPRFEKLEKASVIYHESMEQLKCGNFLLRYKDYRGMINKTILSVDANGNIYKETCILGAENYRPENGLILVSEPKRKILEGVTLSDFLSGKTADEIYNILVDFYDYLFSAFKDKNDENKLINLSPDGYFINYLVSDGTFHVIDNEVIRTSAIEKNYFLMQIKKETFPNLTEKQKDAIYRKLLEHYHCEDKMDFYKKHPVFWGVRWRNENETKEKNKALLEHYFGEASYLPQKTGFGDEGIPALLQRHA